MHKARLAMKNYFRVLRKALRLAGDPYYRRALRLGVGAAIEHEPMLRTLAAVPVVPWLENRGTAILGIGFFTYGSSEFWDQAAIFGSTWRGPRAGEFI